MRIFGFDMLGLLKAKKPSGGGWGPIPGGRKGGRRRMRGGKWEYWYPDKDKPQKEQLGLFDRPAPTKVKPKVAKKAEPVPPKVERKADWDDRAKQVWWRLRGVRDAMDRARARGVRYFASGSNNPGEILGLAEVGIDSGIVADRIKPEVIRAIAEAVAEFPDTRIFVDSGAFSEVDFSTGRPVIAEPISDEEWKERLDGYRKIGEAIGAQLFAVAPDAVAHQDLTLERMKKYAPLVQAVAATGANILIPVQKGQTPMPEFWRQQVEALGVPEEQLVASVPMMKDATSTAEYAHFVSTARPKRVHLLGLGPKNDRFDELVAATPEGTELMCDSVLVTSLVGWTNGPGGGPREYTAAQAVGTEELKAESQRLIAEKLAGWSFEQAAQRLSQWATPGGLKKIAAALKLSGQEKRQLLKDPDDWIAQEGRYRNPRVLELVREHWDWVLLPRRGDKKAGPQSADWRKRDGIRRLFGEDLPAPPGQSPMTGALQTPAGRAGRLVSPVAAFVASKIVSEARTILTRHARLDALKRDLEEAWNDDERKRIRGYIKDWKKELSWGPSKAEAKALMRQARALRTDEEATRFVAKGGPGHDHFGRQALKVVMGEPRPSNPDDAWAYDNAVSELYGHEQGIDGALRAPASTSGDEVATKHGLGRVMVNPDLGPEVQAHVTGMLSNAFDDLADALGAHKLGHKGLQIRVTSREALYASGYDYGARYLHPDNLGGPDRWDPDYDETKRPRGEKIVGRPPIIQLEMEEAEALAHEFGHAVESAMLFLDKGHPNYQELVETHRTIHQRLLASEMQKRSIAVEQAGGREFYWRTTPEMWARTFEQFVHKRMVDRGRLNSMLTHGNYDQKVHGGVYHSPEEFRQIESLMARFVDLAQSTGLLTKALRLFVRLEKAPPGGGWHPVPGGHRGGYRRMAAGKWEYWYPETKGGGGKQLGLFDEPREAPPKPKKHLAVIQRDPALTDAQKAKPRSEALKEAMRRPKSDPREWALPAGARVSDPWEPKTADPDQKWAHPDYGSGTGEAPWQKGEDWAPDLHSYDYVIINSSAGKDSQAMLSRLVELADEQGYSRDKLRVVHADLGRAEWEGTRNLAKEQAEHYGLAFEVVQRQQNDLVEQIEERHGDLAQKEADVGRLHEAGLNTWRKLYGASQAEVLELIGAGKGSSKWAGERRAKELIRNAKRKRDVAAKSHEKKLSAARDALERAQKTGRNLERAQERVRELEAKGDPWDWPVDFGKAIAWPSSDARYCTSDHKRVEVQKFITQLAADHREKTGSKKAPRVLNALGIRAQESASREKMDNFGREKETSGQVVDRWYPIHRWHEQKVWQTIEKSKVPHHKAYDLGMRRLSCVFCVFAQKEDIMVAAKHNPQLFNTYLELEEKVGTAFQPNQSLAEIRDEIARRRAEGYQLNDLAEWVKKALGLPMDLIKSELEQDPTAIGLIMEAALQRLRRHGQQVQTVALDWKARGLCIHFDTASDSQHIEYLEYPQAYNGSMVAAAFAQRHGLELEEHNVPGPMGEDLGKSLLYVPLEKAEPSGGGWGPIPGGRKGGKRRMRGGKWEYWYPEQAKPKERQLGLFDEPAKPQTPKPSKAKVEPKPPEPEPKPEKPEEGPAIDLENVQGPEWVPAYFRERYSKTFLSMAKYNDGHWKSEKQARFLLDELDRAVNARAAAWAEMHGLPGGVIQVAYTEHMKGTGVYDVSRARYWGRVLVIDNGGVVAIGKPKIDHKTGSVNWKHPPELLWKRTKNPPLEVDLKKERAEKTKALKPLRDKIEQIEGFGDNDFLQSLWSRLADGRELTLKQQAALQKYLPEAVSDFKGEAKEAYDVYKKALSTLVGKVGENLIAYAKQRTVEPDDFGDVLSPEQFKAERDQLLADITEAKRLVASDFKGEPGGHWLTRQAVHMIQDHTRARAPYLGAEDADMAVQVGKALKAKKLTKRAAAFVTTLRRMAGKLEKMSDEDLQKLVDKKLPLGKVEKAHKLQGQIDFQGLDVAIENRKGSKRHWVDQNGDKGHTVMVHPYGYIRGIKGADGDELDVYVGPHRDSQTVFVVNQRHVNDKRRFDEHKVLLGFRTEQQAREAYLKHYKPTELGKQLLGSMRVWTMERFRRWLEGKDVKDEPARKAWP